MAKQFVTVETQGFKELLDVFKDLPPQVENQVLGTGVIAGARVIAKAAKQIAPRSQGRLSGGPKGAAAAHAKYGTLRSSIKATLLKKKIKGKRAAVVTRGGAFWGDLVNRGTRYIPASRWYDVALAQSLPTALETMKAYMVAKVTQLSLQAIQRHGANK